MKQDGAPAARRCFLPVSPVFPVVQKSTTGDTGSTGKRKNETTMQKSCFLAGAFPTPWGYVGIAAIGQGLVRVVLPHKRRQEVRRQIGDAFCYRYVISQSKTLVAPVQRILKTAECQILEYLAGKRRSFDLPLAPPQATAFYRAVWRACGEIPYGETRSYQWIAQRIGRPKASRAVGTALAANPLPLIVPCHRVVRGDGSLGGFGGGLALKKRLLALEFDNRA